MKEKRVNLSEFKDFIHNKKIFCYGSGSSGIRAINIMENWGKVQDIIGFSDSDSKKIGKSISNGRISFVIRPWTDVLKEMNHETVLLITCVNDVLELRDKFAEHHELDDFYCFSLVEIAQEQLVISNYDKILCHSEIQVIPKIIHYAWIGCNKPDWVKRNVDSWYSMCPDYEIKEWNEDNYDFTKCIYMKEAYEHQIWGFVPDYARCDIVFQYGGIYLDTDIEILQSPDSLLFQDSFFICDCSFMPNLGSGFGARAGLHILKEFCEYYHHTHFVNNDGELVKLGCVSHQYNVIRKYGYKIKDELQECGGMNIYPMILGATNAHTKTIRRDKKAYFAHYGMGSWMDAKKSKTRIQQKYVGGQIEAY